MNEGQAIYLSNAAARLPSGGDLGHLKSHFLWGCSVSAGRTVPMTSIICTKCCQAWSDGKFLMKLRSTAIAGPRMMKILKKMERAPHKLNRVETNLLERYNQNNRNKMVLICGICKNETLLQFKKRISEGHNLSVTPTMCLDSPQSVKKKKKKDRFAGLNVSAVISVTPSPSSNGRMSSIKSNKVIATPVSVTGQSQTITPRSILNWPNSTPIVPKQSSEPLKLKTGTLSAKRKMNTLREEVRQAQQERVKEGKKALTTRNLNIRRNDKLQMFLNKKEKDINLEDRINSLLQL